MPRIRMLKPEHRLHRKVSLLSDPEYRLWVSMILEADDDGRLVCDARQLTAVTWGRDASRLPEATESYLQHFRKLRLVLTYNSHGVRYAYFPSWRDHQKPKYPTPSKLPIPPDLPPKLGKASPSAPPILPQASPVNRVVSELDRTELDRIEQGRVGSGKGNQEPLLAPSTNGPVKIGEVIKPGDELWAKLKERMAKPTP